MKRWLVLLCVALAVPSSAADFFLQTLTVTSGSSGVFASAIEQGNQYSLQCSSNSRYRACASSSCTATSTDFLVPSNGMDILVTSDLVGQRAAIRYIAIYADGANTTCNLFRVWPATIKAAL